jgi:hypothetical protein
MTLNYIAESIRVNTKSKKKGRPQKNFEDIPELCLNDNIKLPCLDNKSNALLLDGLPTRVKPSIMKRLGSFTWMFSKKSLVTRSNKNSRVNKQDVRNVL